MIEKFAHISDVKNFNDAVKCWDHVAIIGKFAYIWRLHSSLLYFFSRSSTFVGQTKLFQFFTISSPTLKLFALHSMEEYIFRELPCHANKTSLSDTWEQWKSFRQSSSQEREMRSCRKTFKTFDSCIFLAAFHIAKMKEFLQHWAIFLHKRILFMSSLHKRLQQETLIHSRNFLPEWDRVKRMSNKVLFTMEATHMLFHPPNKKERVFLEIPSWCVVNESQDVDTSTRENPRMQWRKSIK